MAYARKTDFLLNTVGDGPHECDFELICQKPPKRNIDCRYYTNCLDAAARVNAPELSCEKCSLCYDNTYKMDEEDFTNLLKFYLAIFSTHAPW